MFTLFFLVVIFISILVFIIYEKNLENKCKSIENTEKQILDIEKKKEKNQLKIIETEIPKINTNDLELQMIDNMKKLTDNECKQITSRVEAILPNLLGASPI